MNLNTVSIFDLSPPEKLQLVEDIWDDLAAIGVGMIKWRNVLGAFYCRVGLESIKDHPFVADVMDVEQA
jgi:hypothetical protein